MASNLTYVVFHKILDHLYLHEIIFIRSVCRQWKDHINRYLNEQKTLVICQYAAIPKQEVLYGSRMALDLSINVFCRKMLRTVYKCVEKLYPGRILKLMPNIERFMFIGIEVCQEKSITKLLKSMKKLKHLTFIQNGYMEFLEANFDVIVSVETLTVGYDTDTIFRIDMTKPIQPDIVSRSDPTPFEKEYRRLRAYNANVVAVQYQYFVPTIQEITQIQFPYLERLVLNQEQYVKPSQLLSLVSAFNFAGKNIKVMEFCDFTFNVNQPKEFVSFPIFRFPKNPLNQRAELDYNVFFARLLPALDEYESLKIVKFQVVHYKMFVAILKNLWRLEWIEEIHLDTHFCHCSFLNENDSEDESFTDDSEIMDDMIDPISPCVCRFKQSDINIIKRRPMKGVKKIVIQPLYLKCLFSNYDFTKIPCDVEVKKNVLLPLHYNHPCFGVDRKFYTDRPDLQYDYYDGPLAWEMDGDSLLYTKLLDWSQLNYS